MRGNSILVLECYHDTQPPAPHLIPVRRTEDVATPLVTVVARVRVEEVKATGVRTGDFVSAPGGLLFARAQRNRQTEPGQGPEARRQTSID